MFDTLKQEEFETLSTLRKQLLLLPVLGLSRSKGHSASYKNVCDKQGGCVLLGYFA